MKTRNLPRMSRRWLNGIYFMSGITMCVEYRSDEALELNMFIKKLGLMPDICMEDYLLNFFETLYF